MTENIVVLFLSLRLLDRELQLTLHPPHEQVVYHDVVGRVVQLVLDPHQLKLPLHLLAVVQHVHRLQQADELRFSALQLGSQQVTHSKHNKVYILPSLVSPYMISCLYEVLDEKVEVLKHQEC